jgi:hypothetical protein
MTTDLARRAFLQAAGSFAAFAVLPGCGTSPGVSVDDKIAGRYLTAAELDTLRAVTARLVPGPPYDADAGALEAGVADAIDHLLGAFLGTTTPPIHAGGPYSNRGGNAHDDFADFVVPDRLVELSWRIRIEGSLGLAEREFAGPVTGFQPIYRAGLALLDQRAQSLAKKNFVALSALQQDAILGNQLDGDVQSFFGTAFAHTVEFLYGPPEYGGNQNLVGWSYTAWDGDRQPTGFSDDEVSKIGAADGALIPTLIAQLSQLLGTTVKRIL